MRALRAALAALAAAGWIGVAAGARDVSKYRQPLLEKVRAHEVPLSEAQARRLLADAAVDEEAYRRLLAWLGLGSQKKDDSFSSRLGSAWSSLMEGRLDAISWSRVFDGGGGSSSSLETTAAAPDPKVRRPMLGWRSARPAQAKAVAPVPPPPAPQAEADYNEDKLAERHDLRAAGPGSLERLKRLKRMEDYYTGPNGLLPETSGRAPGAWEEIGVKAAELKALTAEVGRWLDGPPKAPAGPPLDAAQARKIATALGRIESLRAEVQADLASEQAAEKLLDADARALGRVSRERVAGKETLELHKNMSRLAIVMDMTLARNEVMAAEKVIKQMDDLLAAKLAKIQASQKSDQSSLDQANQELSTVGALKDDVKKQLDSDAKEQTTLATDEGEASLGVKTVTAYQRDASKLISDLDAQDGGAGHNAGVEYQRRIDFLPTVVQWRTNGNPNDPDAFSMQKFKADRDEAASKINDANQGLQKISGVAPDFVITPVITAVPGPVPTDLPVNPYPADLIRFLQNERVPHWQGQLDDKQKSLDTLDCRLGNSNSHCKGTLVDEFGDSYPESLPAWRDQQSKALKDSQDAARQLSAAIDALAADLNGKLGGSLPTLSGLSLKDLQDTLKTYGDKAKAIKTPDSEDPAIFALKMELLQLADLLPQLGHQVVLWSKADATVSAINDALANTLPPARQALAGVVQAYKDIMADIQADIAYYQKGDFGVAANTAVLDRKTALLRDKLIPPLTVAKSAVENVLIPFQQKSIDQAQPNTGDLWKLFDAQRTLYKQLTDLYTKTVAWGVETEGGSPDDPGGSHQRLKSWRDRFQKEIDGYPDPTEPDGRHKGLKEYQTETENRKDPKFDGPETVSYYKDPTLSDGGPFSLPRKIDLYTKERAQRADELNKEDALVNQMAAQIQSLSGGKYNLSAYVLPTNITPDKAGAAIVQALADNKTMSNLGDQLKKIGDEAKAAAGSISLPTGGDAGPPSGTQPPIKIDNNSQIALLCEQAGGHLVDSTLSKAPASNAAARFLFADGVINSSQDGLANKIPKAEKFIADGLKALGDAVNLTADGDKYIDSGGTTLSPDKIYAEHIAVYTELDQFLLEAADFLGVKTGWDNEAFQTVDKLNKYYQAQHDIADGALKVNDAETQAWQKIKDALDKTYNDLEAKRTKINTWLGQLNDKHMSAPRKVIESVAKLQDETRAVLEADIPWQEVRREKDRAKEALDAKLAELKAAQDDLEGELNQEGVRERLDPALSRRVDELNLEQGAWQEGGVISVPKSKFGAFLDSALRALNPQAATQALAQAKASVLADPKSLASLLPQSQVLDVGDADGFYLVYESQFASPHGLDTGNRVTAGNVFKIFGSNVSFTGYQFSSPPNEGNAPYGDKGLEMTVETLKGRSVNYLSVDLHRFALDIPPDVSVAGQARQDRIMIFDDMAVMLLKDRLYIGLAGLADAALSGTADKPYYYGGSAKAELKLNEVMRLNASQMEFFAKDPRKFLQSVNLDFTGYDPDYNKVFDITASGENKNVSVTKVGPSFCVSCLTHSENTFTIDLFLEKVSGTDDINQSAGGVTVLKGFTIKDGSGKPWIVINEKVGAEIGQRYDTISDQLSLSLPGSGVALTASGQLIKGASSYQLQISKRLSDHSTAAVGWGNPYPGMNKRFSITTNNTFTMGELWRKVVDRSKTELAGGKPLEEYQAAEEALFSRQGNSPQTADLRAVWERDVAARLATDDLGRLSKDIQELRRAGAILENMRVRGQIGFVSQPVSPDAAERATGGGFVSGTYTELALTKVQKDALEAKAPELFAEGLRLRDRLLELTREWQEDVAAVVKARKHLDRARFMAANAPNEALRREGEAEAADAAAQLRRATMNYNALAGRPLGEKTPFENLEAGDLKDLSSQIARAVAAPDGIERTLAKLDRSALEAKLGRDRVGLIQWLPWVDRLALGAGAQIQESLSNQIFGGGISVRLPVYDPAVKDQRQSYRLERRASLEEMEEIYAQHRLLAETRRQELEAAREQSSSLAGRLPASIEELSESIREYRNDPDASPEKLRRAFDAWEWYYDRSVDAAADEALAGAVVEPGGGGADGSFLRLTSLDEAVRLAAERSHGLGALALRAQAAARLADAADHRVQKVSLDLRAGMDLTASGTGWIPHIGVTGFPATAVPEFEFKPEEMRALQTDQERGRSAYYSNLRARLEADLALELYQGLVEWQTAERARAMLEREGADDDSRRLAWTQARLDSARALARVNVLLGRDPAAPLEANLSAAESQLASRLATLDPVRSARGVLAERARAAKDAEILVEKGYRLQQLSLDPVSWTVRVLGRIITTVGGGGGVSEEDREAARAQAIEAGRARDAFEESLETAAAGARAELAQAQSELDAVPGTGLEAELARNALRGRTLSLRAQLRALGADPDALAAVDRAFPGDIYALKGRLEDRERSLAAAQSPQEDAFDPGREAVASIGHGRLFYSRQTLGRKHVGQEYAEGWIEVALKTPGLSPERALALKRLADRRDDALRSGRLIQAAADADARLAAFESDVLFKRSLDRAAPGDPRSAELDRRLEAEAAELAARIGLPIRPGETLKRLSGLVPEDAAADEDPDGVARRTVELLRSRELNRLRQALFEGPGDPAGKDALAIEQLRADVLLQRMSYRGVTPVAAFGLFRASQKVGGFFLQAPDPRDVESGLQSVVTDAAREQLESSGRLRELALRLQGLMAAVQDGALQVEARRRAVEAAEGEYRARLAEAEDDPAAEAEAALARDRLVAGWMRLGEQATATRADFVRLVAELEALGKDGGGDSWRRALPPPPSEPPSNRDRRGDLLSYWAERVLDPAFAARQEAALREAGVAPEKAARVAELSRDLRASDELAEGVRHHKDFSTQERWAALRGLDCRGKREKLRAALSGLLEPSAPGEAPPAAVLRLLKADLEDASKDQDRDVAGRAAADQGLRQAFWSRAAAPAELQAAFGRLEGLAGALETSRQALLESYLSEKGDDPGRFVLKDARLDGYLRASQRYDEEVLRVFSLPELRDGDEKLVLALDDLYDLRGALARRQDAAKSGRGLLAMDALIMLEQSRRAAAPWAGLSRDEIDRIDEALETLRERKARWQAGAADLSPLYAVTSVARDGQRVWTAEDWLTREEVDKRLKSGEIVSRSGRLFLGEGREVVGGLDALEAARDRAAEAASENERTLSRGGGAAELSIEGKPGGYSAAAVFGKDGLLSQGKVLLFEAPELSTGRPRRALHPIEALSLAPEKYAIYVLEDEGIARDRYPTWESFQASGEFASSSRLRLSAAGAEALGRMAEAAKARDEREGWLETKLAYGFARDEKGRFPRKVYSTRRDFEAGLDRLPKGWTMYKSADLKIWLDAEGAPVQVSARPAEGKRVLDERLGPGEARVALHGALYGVVPDEEGRVKEFFTSDAAVQKAAKSWELKSVALDQPGISGSCRLSHYESGGRPVLLSDRYLSEQLSAANAALGSAEHWAARPWRWGDLVLEIPRELVGTPLEVFGGRDPRHEHALGRINALRSEGMETEHRGLMRRLGDAVDVLDLHPDPVDPVFDRSLLPPPPADGVRPGRVLYGRTWRDPATGKDFRFGAKAIARGAGEIREDLNGAGDRVVAHFDGGYDETIVALRRDSSGLYQESHRLSKSGTAAVRDALSDPAVFAARGEDAVVSAAPKGHDAERVERRVTLRPGAAFYAKEAEALRAYPQRLAVELSSAAARAADVARALADAEAALAEAITRREKERGPGLDGIADAVAWRRRPRARLAEPEPSRAASASPASMAPKSRPNRPSPPSKLSATVTSGQPAAPSKKPERSLLRRCIDYLEGLFSS